MNSTLKKLISLVVLTTLVLLGCALLLFVTLGYPNDARITSGVDPEGLAPGPRYRRVGSLLTTGVEFSIDRTDEEIQAAKKTVVSAAPQFVLANSRRFKLPGQIHVPVGKYPERIEARDVLILPPGATLRLKVAEAPGQNPPFEARFSAVGLSGSFSLILPGKEVKVPAVTEVVNPEGFWYRMAGRFLKVDRGGTGSSSFEGWRWTDVRFSLTEAKSMEIRCADGGPPCLISDVGIYEKGESSRRNVLVIMIDTLRADAVRQGHMPALSGLADRSVDFKKAIAPGNMTSPSTNAFLSCQRPSDLGAMAFSYTLSPEDREEFYAKEQPSFAEFFRRSGYQTAMIGNVSVVSESVGVGVNHGFERVLSIEVDGYDTPRVASEALSWLQDHGDSPFLLYVHFNGPHAPYRAPFRDIFATFPGWSAFSSLGSALRWLYQAEVRYTDRYLQVLMDGVQKLGLSESTTVVVTADHGDQMSDRRFQLNEAGPAYEGAYYDHGGTMLNDEIQVPLVISGASRVIEDWVQTTDIGPTLLDLAGISVPPHCSGLSLVSYLDPHSTLPPTGFAARRILGSEGFRHRAIIFGNRYKYIRGYATNDRKLVLRGTWRRTPTQVFTREELYDIDQDPGEFTNLASTHKELLQRARSEFKTFYHVGDGYELVVESPGGLPVEVAAGNEVNLKVEGKSVSMDGVFKSSGRDRYLLSLEQWDQVPPTVAVDGKRLQLKYTASRLPIDIQPEELPVESPGEEGLLPVGTRPEAYLRRIEPNDLQVRRIVTGNPMFDKVLREWGYLNDN